MSEETPKRKHRRFPGKGEVSPQESNEESFARDILNCESLDEAQELAQRVIKEWSDFWASC